jgi:ABC-type transport system involved in multi-copper enzyme maturation permease subunit
MFANVLGIEWTKLVRRRLLWVEVGILTLLVVVFEALLYAVFQANGAGGQMVPDAREGLAALITWPGALSNLLSFATGSSLGGLLVIILVGAVTAQEYTWRTLHLWLSRGTSRALLLVAKAIALVPTFFLFVLTPLVVGGALTAVFTVWQKGALDLSQVSAVQLGLSALRTAYSLFPYASLTFLLAVFSRSAVTAIGGGLAYALLVEGVVVQIFALAGGTLAQVGQYLPGGMAAGLMQANRTGGALVVNGQRVVQHYLDPNIAAVGIALYTVLFVGLAIWAFRRQDLSG